MYIAFLKGRIPLATDVTSGAVPVDLHRTRWQALAMAMLGYAGVQLGNSPVSTIMPTLAEYFHVPVDLVTWVLTANLLALTALILPAGRLGDRYGHRRVVLGGLTAYAISTLLAGLAPSLAVLLALRVAQGLASAFILGPCMALAIQAFPGSYRGRVVGLVTLSAYIGSGVGAYLAALAVTFASWRWAFFMLLPPLLAGILVGLWVADGPAPDTGRRLRLDWTGAALLAGALVAVSLSLNHLHEGAETWADGWSWHLPGHIAAAVLLWLFVRAQRRAAEPLLPLAYLRNRGLVAALGAHSVLHLTMMGSMATIPFIVQKGMELSPTHTAGVVLLLQLLSLILAPVSGWLYDRADSRLVLPGAMVILGSAMLFIGYHTTRLSYAGLLGMMAWMGVGMGLFLTANNAAIMGTVPPELRGFASGMIETTRQMAHAVGATVAGTLLAPGLAAYGTRAAAVLMPAAFRSVWWLMGAMAAVGLLCAIWHGLEQGRGAARGAPDAVPAGD